LDAVINNADFKQEFIAEYPDLRKNNPKSKLPNLTGLFSEFKSPEDFVLNAKNKNAYYLLRAIYNYKLSDPYVLLTLMYHSFNNMFRLSKAKSTFNVPFGQRTFNDTAQENLLAFIEKIQTKTVAFMDWPIENWSLETIKTTDLMYFDPPYENAGAAYNVIWDDHKDGKTLLEILDYANDLGKSWAMSNVFHNNGKHNDQLEKWAQKYDVVYLSADYSNSYYTRQKAKTVEVLIKNYD
jgi:site-specific DNA-adenine methylase